MNIWEERELAYKESFRFGLKDIDEKTNGIPKHRLWALGGRPGEGKTMISLQWAMQWADRGKKIVYFSNEQDKATIYNQLSASMCKQNSMDIAIGNIADDFKPMIEQAWDHINKSTLKIFDQMEAMDGINIAKILHAEKPDFFLYDNLQMMRKNDSWQKKHEAIEDLLINMKTYIMRNPVSGILLSQCNRNTETRKYALPSLGDLKDSGAIEQLCDGVIFVCWPWRWANNKNIDGDNEGKFLYNDYFLEIAKNRYGSMGTAKVKFIPEWGRIEDYKFESQPNRY